MNMQLVNDVPQRNGLLEGLGGGSLRRVALEASVAQAGDKRLDSGPDSEQT